MNDEEENPTMRLDEMGVLWPISGVSRSMKVQHFEGEGWGGVVPGLVSPKDQAKIERYLAKKYHAKMRPWYRLRLWWQAW